MPLTQSISRTMIILLSLLKVSMIVSTLGAILLLNYNYRYFLAFTDNQTYWLYHFCVAVVSLIPITAVFGLPTAGSFRSLIVGILLVPTIAVLVRQEQQ